MKKIVVGSDVSIISKMKYATGVQRVMVETHKNLKQSLKSETHVLLGVNLSGELNFLNHSYLASDPVLNGKWAPLDEIDVLLELDGNIGYIYNEFDQMKRRIPIITLIHDLLPIKYPEYFEGIALHYKIYILKILRISSHIIFTSKKVKDELEELGWQTSAQKIVIPLGAFDIPPATAKQNILSISLLVINTIEPRKGYRDVLDAFDILVAQGHTVEITIVGKYGWNSDEIRDRIKSHQLFGKSLHWYSGITDQEIRNLYSKSNISIVASMDEGFGLTLEEGLANSNKVIARDIPVFRERSNRNLYFFDGDGESLAEKILEVSTKEWDPNGLKEIRTMRDFAAGLAELILGL